VLTVVDAKHAQKQLDEHDEARRQVAFADRILVSKTDLVDDESKVDELMTRLRDEPARPQVEGPHGQRGHQGAPISGV
jgi:G3E family GTPase